MTLGSHAPAPQAGELEGWVDGCCPGNPGPMAVGIVLADPIRRLRQAERLGAGTNNVAEWTAFIRTLQLAAEWPYAYDRLVIYTDSQLVQRQVTGEYAVNHPNLIPLYDLAKALI